MKEIAKVLCASRPWRLGAAVALALVSVPSGMQAKDKLLDEAVDFTGTLFFLESKVPGLVLGVVRNGEVSVSGFGKVRPEENRAPDGKTLMRIGSITKVFTGAVLASLVTDGVVKFTDPLQRRLGWDVTIPTKDGKGIRLIDLVTHTSGLPREAERAPAPSDNPFQTITKDAFIRNLQGDPLLFPPGTGALYSNFAFDLLAQALTNAAGKPYEDLLRERVLMPAGLASTVFAPKPEQRRLLMQGHNFDGTPLPDVPTGFMILGSAGSTPRLTTSCDGSPGTWIDFRRPTLRCACSITRPMCIAMGSARCLVWTNPATWMRWVWDGSS